MKYIELNKLNKLDGNPRTCNTEKFQQLIASIEKFGVIEGRPFLVSNRTGKNIILGGNQRYEACKQLDIKKVPYYLFEDLTEEEEKEIIIRDNISNGEWDYEILSSEWNNEDLKDWGLDVDFESVEDKSKEEIEDDVPEIQENIIVEKGDIFQIGEHRLMCGSSTDVNDLEKLLDGNKSDMVFTDPPYLMDFTGGIHADGSKSFNAKHGGIKNDKMSKEDGEQFLDDINTNILMYNKGAFYITFYRLGIDNYFASMNRVGLQNRSLIIWNKGNHTLSNSDYMSKYEPMFYGWCDEHNFYGGNNGMDIWEIARTKKNDLHPTMKPVELVDKAINDGSKRGDLVLDLFGGSGTTLISAEKNGRKSCLMELDEKYIQVIIKRYYDYTDGEKEIKCLNRELDLKTILQR